MMSLRPVDDHAGDDELLAFHSYTNSTADDHTCLKSILVGIISFARIPCMLSNLKRMSSSARHDVYLVREASPTSVGQDFVSGIGQDMSTLSPYQ